MIGAGGCNEAIQASEVSPQPRPVHSIRVFEKRRMWDYCSIDTGTNGVERNGVGSWRNRARENRIRECQTRRVNERNRSVQSVGKGPPIAKWKEQQLLPGLPLKNERQKRVGWMDKRQNEGKGEGGGEIGEEGGKYWRCCYFWDRGFLESNLRSPYTESTWTLRHCFTEVSLTYLSMAYYPT